MSGGERDRRQGSSGSGGERPVQRRAIDSGKRPRTAGLQLAARSRARLGEIAGDHEGALIPSQRTMVGPGYGSPIPPGLLNGADGHGAKNDPLSIEPDRPEPGGDGGGAAEVAAAGVARPGQALPHGEAIQRAFGHHDISGVQAHVGGDAAAATDALGAEAFTTGSDVAFREPPDLHLAAHEAAHVVQQRGGVQLKDGVGRVGDRYEQHADAVADRVVRGESAEELLGQLAGGASSAAVQMSPAGQEARADAEGSARMQSEGQTSAAVAARAEAELGGVDRPEPGMNKTGFIDNSDGANIRTRPRESGGNAITAQPLPPATRVFVSGHHKDSAEWWYVTAFLSGTIVRGYVQGFRVTTDLPEPTAKLYHLKGGETVEGLAKQEFSASVRDGHDLRYYENVLLHVNQQQGRAGITGTYQDPNLFGGGANNIQLVAGHRIWLVSPAYAKALEGIVPDGSLTNGAVAKARRFAGHLLDILKSIAESRNHLDAVAGEYAQVIRDHLPEIVGVVSAFIAAEAASAFLAATPTGVGQIAAVVIQLGLAAFGAAGMVQAGIEALGHAESWLSLAWTAQGKDEQIAAAGKEFLRMLVALAIAYLARKGIKGNMDRATAFAGSMPTMMPALAIAGGGQQAGSQVGTAALAGFPGSAGPVGTALAMAARGDDERGSSKKESTDQAKERAERFAARTSTPNPQRVKIDMEHVIKRHVRGGGETRTRNLWPDEMTGSDIEKVIRNAYRGSVRVNRTTRGDPVRRNVLLRGKATWRNQEMVIDMFYNQQTRTIESAWWVHGPVG